MKPSQKLHLIAAVSLLAMHCSTAGTADSNESTEPDPSSHEREVTTPEPSFETRAVAELGELEITDGATVVTVQARLQGADGTFVVDTTASHNMVTREFADAQDIVLTESLEIELGGDRIEAGDMRVKSREAVFPDLPEVEATHELAGVIAPQHLYAAKNRYTTLNLDDNTMLSVEAGPKGLKAWLRLRFGGRQFHTLERQEGRTGELPHIAGEVNGSSPQYRVLLDTTTDVSLFKATALGVADEDARCLETSGGECQMRGVVAEGQTVSFGHIVSPEFTAVGTTSTLEEPGVDGVLGRDAMQHFLWVFPADDDKPIRVARAE